MEQSSPPSEGGTNIEGESPVEEPTVETDEATITEDAELERTLGLSGGLAIGIGTMIGGGVFVFPGLVAGRAGPAAAGRDAVDMGKRAPSLRSLVIGEETERVAAEMVGPVVVVRRDERQIERMGKTGRSVERRPERAGTSA
jgi:hypothetical protein